MIKNSLIAISFVLSVSAFIIVIRNTSVKNVYINVGKVYSEFKLSKELNKELENIRFMRKQIIDSIYKKLTEQNRALQLSPKQTKQSIELFQLTEQEYNYKQKEFERESETLS